MRKICSPLAFLLIISTPLFAEEITANSLPSLPPVSSNTLDAMPSVDIPDIVPASPPLQVELPPVDASVLKTAIEPLLAPEIYRTVLDAMTDQIKAIKMDRVAISFTPRHVAYEAETNKVFVSGELKSQGSSSKPDIKPRTYEFIIAIKNYRPSLVFIDVYPDDPRTLERLKAMQSQHRAPTP